MRPGSAPLDEMVRALSEAGLFGPEARQSVREKIGLTSMGLVVALQHSILQAGESLLLVVDQFEELFRFGRELRDKDAGAERSLFVAALLEAVDQLEVPAYVVLTMRSDFLGDCAQFEGLPEILNSCQYLVPRLTREQRQEAVEGPLRVVGARMSPRLVQRLLNDAGEDPDQLPILQHALMTTFRKWKDQGGKGEIDLPLYEDVGGIEGALNRHADDVYSRLSAEDQHCTQRLFRCLTTTDGGRAVRRPARLERIMAVVGASGDPQREEQVKRIILQFAALENSFLVLTSGRQLTADSVVDISHESLIRKWETLQGWVRQETESAEWYLSLVRDARLYKAGAVGLLRDPDLKQAWRRCSTDGWNETWAAQYAPGFHDVPTFLRKSRLAQRRRRFLIGTLVALILVAAGEEYARYRFNIEKEQHKQLELRYELAQAFEQGAQAQHDIAGLQKALADARNPADQQRLRSNLKRALDQLNQAQEKGANTKQELANIAQKAPSGDDHVSAATAQIDTLQARLEATQAQLETMRIAPVIRVSPEDGSVFDHYPRTTKLVWKPVPRATSYSIERIFLQRGQCSSEADHVPPAARYKIITVNEISYTFDFVGAQPGCWRVWAVYQDGTEGPKGDWWEFTYTR